ncbi:MAG: hypothetical protein NC431_03370 [Firmicutes bacterium]|nr:hypothetical protein [Bacillota bacterium]
MGHAVAEAFRRTWPRDFGLDVFPKSHLRYIRMAQNLKPIPHGLLP